MVTLTVISLTTNTSNCTFLLDIQHSVTVEYVNISTSNVNVGRSCKTSVNPGRLKELYLMGATVEKRGHKSNVNCAMNC